MERMSAVFRSRVGEVVKDHAVSVGQTALLNLGIGTGMTLGARFAESRLGNKTIAKVLAEPMRAYNSYEDALSHSLVSKTHHQLLFHVAVRKPIEEEVTFRLLPSHVLTEAGDSSTNYVVGAVSSVLFAREHHSEKSDANTLGNFLKRFQFAQFALGMWYWKLQRQRGFTHSLLAHGVVNAIGFSARRRAKTLLEEAKSGHETTSQLGAKGNTGAFVHHEEAVQLLKR